MSVNWYIRGEYAYTMHGFIQASPEVAPTEGGVVLKPPVLQGYIPGPTGHPSVPASPPHQVGYYPFTAIGQFTFDGRTDQLEQGAVIGRNALNFGGFTSLDGPRPNLGSPATKLGWYTVYDDRRWGVIELGFVDAAGKTHMHRIFFVIADDRRELKIATWRSSPRMICASGTMTRVRTPGPVEMLLNLFTRS